MMRNQGAERFVAHKSSNALWYCAAAAIILSACSEDTEAEGNQHLEQRDSAGIMVVEHPGEQLSRQAPSILADAPEFRLGALDGPPELQFTRIVDAVRLSDGAFAILDRAAAEVRLFDIDGTFIHSFGRAGEGPGEFGAPARLARVNGDDLLVWDWGLGRLSRFSRDGSVVDDVGFGRLTISTILALADGSLIAVLDESPSGPPPQGGGRMQNSGQLVRMLPHGEVEVLEEYPGTEWEIQVVGGGAQILRPWHYPQHHIAATPEGVWTSDGTSWEVVRRSVATGAVDRIVRFQRPLEAFTADRVQALHEAELARAESDEARAALESRQVDGEYPETVPPIWALFGDASGRLWVAPLEMPGYSLPGGLGRTATEWVILNEQGLQVEGTLALPKGRRPLYADHDGVLLVTVDELDVPFVEWWPFH